MRKIVKKVVLWACSVCNTRYKNKSDAKTCEKKPVEEKKFKIGEQVTNFLEPRTCGSRGEYRFKGKITKIFGPQPPDEEYWIKWLGGLPSLHVFLYEVTYTCPKCGHKERCSIFCSGVKKDYITLNWWPALMGLFPKVSAHQDSNLEPSR